MPEFDTKPFYAVLCSYPGCASRDDTGEYQWWGEPEDAISAALDGDWRIEDTEPRANARIYCGEHPARWLEDEPEQRGLPEPESGLVLDLPGGEVVALAVP